MAKKKVDKKKVEESPVDETQLLEEAKKFKKDKEKERKQIKATKDLIHKRSKQLMDVPVEIDEDDEGRIIEAVFKARRLSKHEMEKFRSFNLTQEEVLELSEEEKDEITSEGYELLSIAIVDPAMSPEEWEETDLALTQDLVYKLGILQNEPNDGRVIQSFKDLSNRLMM